MEAVQTSAFSDAAPYQTYSSLNRQLFLNRRDLRIGLRFASLNRNKAVCFSKLAIACVVLGKRCTFVRTTDHVSELLLSQKIITLHIVPSQVLYTSLMNHNERFNTQQFWCCALSSGRTVTARITPANITVINGVVHQIYQLLGFVYNTAVEEIAIDPVTQNFEQFITVGRKDLQNDLTSANGVTVFAPINQAMYAIANVYQNYMNNQSLIDMVIEMSMLMQGQHINFMDYNAGYESYVTVVSRYNGRLIKVYSEGNDTWVEGGYVQARVVKPDIGVTNGVVHQIDAVFGIPTRDIPYTIFCKDWLASTFVQMQYVGLT
ncbi:unnamed protein product, partial [Candidula unifasciata]